MFDLLTYEKGASVLRMLEQYIGPEVFRDGVRLYLERHRFGNAETTDLWKALGDASRQPIPEVMDGWIFRPGLSARARRGRWRRASSSPSGASPIWREGAPPSAGGSRSCCAPRSSAGSSRSTCCSTATTWWCRCPPRPDWVVVNAGGHGFYRVRYAPPLLKKLSRRARRGSSPIERFNLVSDAFALTQAGAMQRRRVPRAHRALHRGDGPQRVDGAHRLVRVRESGDPVRAAARTRGPRPPPARPRRWSASAGRPSPRRASSCGSSAAISSARSARSATIPSRRSAPERSTRGSARTSGAVDAERAARAHRHRGGERRARREYAEFWERFRAARTPQEEQRYLYALAGFRQPDLVRRTLGTRSTARCGARTRRSSCARCSAASTGASWPGSSSRSTGRRWRAVPGQRVSARVRGHHRAREPAVGARGPGILRRRAESSSAARRSSSTWSSSGWPCGSRSASRRRSGRTSVGRGADRSAEASAHPALRPARARADPGRAASRPLTRVYADAD